MAEGIKLPNASATQDGLLTTGVQTIAGAKTFNNDITSKGLLDISAATAGQIKFPAVQNPSINPKTLDDYEEGPWTPQITLGGGATEVTYSVNTGTYIKIGKEVFIYGTIQLSSKGSSTGTWNISNLPAPIENSTGADCAALTISSKSSLVNSSGLVGKALQNTNTFQMRLDSATTFGLADDTNLQNNSAVWFIAHYPTTS